MSHGQGDEFVPTRVAPRDAALSVGPELVFRARGEAARSLRAPIYTLLLLIVISARSSGVSRLQ